MKYSEMGKIKQFLQKPWLYSGIIIIAVLVKFYKLENRYFWFDEICTIQHTSGNQIIYSPVNEIKNISFFSQQLHLKNQDLTIGSEIKGLYSSTNLNPLHYTLLIFWYRIAGDNDMSYRYFNIFIFILTLPVLFLLGKSLFKSSLAGWIIITLYAVSPYIHYCVTEARYHILVLFLISLLHYLFLVTANQKKIKWWIVYSLTGIFALYASIMSGIFLLGHALYILFMKRKIWLAYSISLLIIMIAYLPWILSMINNEAEITSSLAWHTSWGFPGLFKLLLSQFVAFAKFFILIYNRNEYLSFLVFNEANGSHIQLFVDSIFIIIILISIVYTIRKSPPRVWLFLVFIVIPYIMFFLISDIFRQALGSFIWRYHIPNLVGILLFVSYLIYKKIELGKLFYSGVYLSLIIIGLISIYYISKDRCYFIGLGCEENITEARIFSEAEKSLLISDYTMSLGTGTGGFIALLNECESDNIDVLHASPDIKNVNAMLSGVDYSDIYVTYASSELVNNLKSQFGERMDSVDIEGISPMWLIKLE